MERKRYFNEVTIMKAIATLFITWFHFKWTVPDVYQSLFIGGAIGNSIFFFCSGYLVKFKKERYKGEWLVKKYFRLMPAVWITLSLMIICTLIKNGTFIKIPILEWFYPMQFWFVRAILLYFMVTYLVFNINKCVFHKHSIITKTSIGTIAIIFTLLHFVYYFRFGDKNNIILDDNSISCWFYWFIFFIWGYYARNYGDSIEKHNGGGIYSIIWSIFSIVLFFTYKRIAPSIPGLVVAQCIFIPALLACIIIAFRKLAKYLMHFNYTNNTKAAITLLSNITLEIYIVQMYIINWLMPQFTFPANIPITFCVIIVIGYIVHIVATWLTSKLRFL